MKDIKKEIAEKSGDLFRLCSKNFADFQEYLKSGEAFDFRGLYRLAQKALAIAALEKTLAIISEEKTPAAYGATRNMLRFLQTVDNQDDDFAEVMSCLVSDARMDLAQNDSSSLPLAAYGPLEEYLINLRS